MGRGAKGVEAEKLVQHWLEAQGWLVHRAARAGLTKLPGGRFICRSHDLFGAIDLLAIRRAGHHADGIFDETWAMQVTTQSGRAARRERVAAIAWPTSWRVSLASHETTQDPANRARHQHWLKVEDLIGKDWQDPIAIRMGQ